MTLSIIIIMHNGIQSIKNCLEAVNSQINFDDELILLDNGSTDSSNSVIKDFVLSQGFVKKILLEHNVGISIGRNIAARQAEGDFLLFLDSDIILMPNALPVLRTECLLADAIIGAYTNKGTGLIWYREIKYRALSKKKTLYVKSQNAERRKQGESG